MPIYEYVCKDCEKQFEVIRPMSQADAPLACPACGRQQSRRKLAVFYAHSGGHAVAGTSGGCGSCEGGGCGSCGHSHTH
jgi:putative FmdB family regulatory protein